MIIKFLFITCRWADIIIYTVCDARTQSRRNRIQGHRSFHRPSFHDCKTGTMCPDESETQSPTVFGGVIVYCSLSSCAPLRNVAGRSIDTFIMIHRSLWVWEQKVEEFLVSKQPSISSAQLCLRMSSCSWVNFYEKVGGRICTPATAKPFIPQNIPKA